MNTKMEQVNCFYFNHRKIHMSDWGQYFWKIAKNKIPQEKLQSLRDLDLMIVFFVFNKSKIQSGVTVSIMPIENDNNEMEYISRRNIRLCINGIYGKVISEYSNYYVHIESEPIFENFLEDNKDLMLNRTCNVDEAYDRFREWFISKYPGKIYPLKSRMKDELNF